MTIGSLFAGIGGLELGLERAGFGPVRWQVEIDKQCQRVLAAHWPEANRYEDVRTVGATTLAPVDLICGGFPCQDVSSAGKRVGIGGARSGLWFEYLRIVREIRPRWVVVENVTSGAHAWVDTVLEGLGEQGYACLPIPIAAADCGALHLRRRIFIVAHADCQSEPAGTEHAKMGRTSALPADADCAIIRNESGGGFGENRTRPRIVANDGVETSSDVVRARREGTRPTAHTRRSGSSANPWGAPVPEILRVVHGIPDPLDAAPRARIKALGNSVVPQCAEVVGHVIRKLLNADGEAVV